MLIRIAPGTLAKATSLESASCIVKEPGAVPQQSNLTYILLSRGQFFWVFLIIVAIVVFGRPIYRILSGVADRIKDGDDVIVWKASIRGTLRPLSEINDDIQKMDI